MFILFLLMASLSFAGDVNKFDGKSPVIILKNKLDAKDEVIKVKFKNADIREVLDFFSKEFNLNIIAGAEVKGSVTFSFDYINPIDAFNSVLLSQGMSWYEENNVVYVYQQQPFTVIRLNYARASDILTSISRMVAENGSIAVNESSNSLIIKAPQGDIQKIEKVIQHLDMVPLQVLVEVKIMELNADDNYTMGVNPLYNQANGNAINANGFGGEASGGATGIFVKVMSRDLQVLVEALENRRGVNVLATPKILTVNHKPASIITGQRLGYKTSSTSTTGTLVNESINFLEVGTKLSFTPHISENGDIIMEIKPEVSEGSIANGLPQETTTEATTEVMVRDGQTIIIGGLIKEKQINSKIGIPVLLDLPFIGALFGRTEIQKTKSETVVLITPHLIRPDQLDSLNVEIPKFEG